MERFAELWRKLLFLVRRGRLDRDLEEEMRFHLDMKARKNREAGMDAPDARHAARRQFGNVTRLREVSREVWGWGWLERCWQDVTYALRLLRKNPGFTAVAGATLALGIGANTVIYSTISTIWFHPFPVPEAGRLVVVRTENPARHIEAGRLSWPEFRALRGTASFAGVTVLQYTGYNLAGASDAVRVSGLAVTSGFFATAGVQPALGRAFLPGEEDVAVLSYRFWQRELGGDRGRIGGAVRLDGRPYTVVGVMPRGFWFPDPGADVYTPIPRRAESEDPARRYLLVLGRLRPGASLDTARSECGALERRASVQFPASEKGWTMRPVRLRDLSSGDRILAPVLLGMVGAVLLIACGNVGTLLLARSAGRERELAVRLALGATRLRLARQIVVEGLVLASLGALGGLLLGAWGVVLLRKLYAGISPVIENLSMNWRAVAAALLLTVLAGLAVSLGPLWRTRRLGARCGAGKRAGISPGRARLQMSLVATEVALASVLLLVCGLLLRTLYRLESQRLGFDTRQVLVFRIAPDELHYGGPTELAGLYRRVLAGLREQPGIEAAGAVSRLPTAGGSNNPTRAFAVEGSRVSVQDVLATPGYFAALRIPLLRGRDLSAGDQPGSPPVAVVSQTAAERYWPGGDPLGRRIQLDPDSAAPRWVTVVGVAGDVRNDNAAQPPVPMLYLPLAQYPVRSVSFAVRTNGDAMSALAAARQAVRAVDRNQPLFDANSMDEVVRRDLAGTRIVIGMLGVFAGLALALAAIGIYGVISYAVRERTPEIGVRLALGAAPRDVRGMVLRQGMWPALAGGAAGFLVGIAAGHAIRGVLYGVQPTDPLAVAAVCGLVAGAALLACYIPAFRASRIDPMEALRYE